MDIKTGDTITLKPEWMDEGDENIHFVASEDYDGYGRLYIHDADCTMHITPEHLIRVEMIVQH